MGPEEKKFINQALENNFPNEGKLTALFEEKVKGLLGTRYAVATTNCTAAMFLVLKGLGVGLGDEVIVPDITFIATASAVDLCGAKPVLVDINPTTLCMDTFSFEKAITKNTKAVIPVHVNGRACDMASIVKIARKHSIHVVEDAAEALMSKHKSVFLGTYGKAGCFSFSPNKTITTGQGGMVVTNDSKLHRRLRELKDQGRPKRGTGGDDRHDATGYNFKFTDIQAALGLGQLTYLKSRLKRMKEIYKRYLRNLKGVDGISLFNFNIDKGEIPQWTDVFVESRKGLCEYLRANNIDFRRYWFPIHSQKPYKLPDSKFPNSTKLSPKALWLPSAFTLSDSDVDRVSDCIKKWKKK